MANPEASSYLAQMASFRDYEIMIEYKNLPSEEEFSRGMYLMPKMNTTQEFEGVYFVPNGPYAKAIIRFTLRLPAEYPRGSPIVRIISRFFHPLLQQDKTMRLDLVPIDLSTPCNTSMCATLRRLELAFEEHCLYALHDKICVDEDAIRLLKSDRMAFDELLGECIKESIEFAQSSRSGMICLGAPPYNPGTEPNANAVQAAP